MSDVLNLGFVNRGYQLGTGIISGWEWDFVAYWLKNQDIEKLNWRDSGFVCKDCGDIIYSALVPAPISIIIFRCKNGHKFCYENTD